MRSGLIIGVISCSAAIYSVWLTSLDPIWKAVLAQFANAGVFTPGPLHLPILLGLAFVVALFTAMAGRPFHLQDKDNNTLFLMAWFWISFVLIYLPVDYQIHMLNGWQVPIAILATQGVFRYGFPLLQRWQHGRGTKQAAEKWLPLFFLLLVLPTNLYLLSWRFFDLARHDYPYYLYKDEIAALSWLEGHVETSDVILSSLTIGQYVPAHTGAHAFLAHWAQTIDFYEKQRLVESIYSQETPIATVRTVLNQYGVDYVFCGPSERAMGSCENVHRLGSLVFETQRVQLIAVAR